MSSLRNTVIYQVFPRQYSKTHDFKGVIDDLDRLKKLNIDYFLEEVMDEDHVDDIYDYFMESETDSLDDAIEELGGDYSEDEIRLVRIKFLSEQAN